jgi:multiple sugar transport system substrate-binding protein
MLGKRNRLVALVGLVLVVILSGCSSGGGGTTGSGGASGADTGSQAQKEAAKPAGITEPLTLQMFLQVPIADDDLNKLIVDPLKKKFPQLTLEFARNDAATGGNLTERIGAGYAPDLLLAGFFQLGTYTQLDVPYELDDLIKQSALDLNSFNPVAVNALRGYSDKGKLLGLPLYMNVSALFYNKDLFDKFAVGYPKDNMSWDQIAELARKVSRTDAGVNYFGLYPGSAGDMGSALTIQNIDVATNKAQVNNDKLREVFQMMKTIYSIPDNDFAQMTKLKPADAFFKDKVLAMYTFYMNGVLTQFKTDYNTGKPMNWDMVTQPYFKSLPGVGAKTDAHLLILGAQSKHKQEAFSVIQYLATSKDVQNLMSQEGKIPALNLPDVAQNYGKVVPFLQGKNVQVLFKTKMAPLPKFHPLEASAVNKPVNDALNDVVTKGVDINTALAKAQEQVQQNINDQMGK